MSDNLSTPFLKLVAENFYHEQLKMHKNAILIFPNKRMIAYFRKYLAETIGKAEISPIIYTIDAFIREHIKITVAEKLNLIFELYDAYKVAVPSFNQNLDEFYAYADTLLADFNELDNYLISSDIIFQNIKNLTEYHDTFEFLTTEQIEILRQFWSYFNQDKLSNDKQKFLQIWEAIPAIYKQFKNQLESKKLAYSGMQLRLFYEKLQADYFLKRKYFVVGFNALNEAHLRIFELMGKNGHLGIYWDIDNYYIKNEIQEAGLFLRKNIKRLEKYSIRLSQSDSISPKASNIEVISVPGRVAQAQIMSKIIEQIPVDKNIGIILPDEKMLFPVLHNMPPEARQYNITMGYPFNNTQIYQFLSSFFRMHQYRLELKGVNQFPFHHQSLKQIIDNPLVKTIFLNLDEELYQLLKKNAKHVHPTVLQTNPHTFINQLFTITTEVPVFLEGLREILYHVFSVQNAQETKQNIELEFIIQAYNVINKLSEQLQRPDISLMMAIKICLQEINALSIPFDGEKLDQIQIMGLMESRSIDFDFLIMLDANEGILPNVSKTNSFIPQMIRKAFEMPVTAYQDAIFSYLFYRLLQKPEKSYIMYNNLEISSSKAEKSRYLTQLEFELVIAEPKQAVFKIPTIDKTEIYVETNDEIRQKLIQYLAKNQQSAKKISSTFLETFQMCRLKFYFKYLSNLRAEENDEFEALAGIDIGNILHKTMFRTYHSLQENNRILLTKDSRQKLMGNLDKIVDEELVSNYKLNDISQISGDQHLSKSIVKKYAQLILDFDTAQKHQIEILEMEANNKYNWPIEIELDGEKYFVVLSGIIDRIDKTDKIRVIDYKTGEVKKEFKSIAELFDPNLKKKEILQVFLYSVMYYKKTGQMPTPLIYDVRKMDKQFSPYIYLDKQLVTDSILAENLEAIEAGIKELLEAIFHPQITYYQTEDEKWCKYCDYKQICKK